MIGISKKTCLYDSFEAQKRTAHAVTNGLLDKEMKSICNIRLEQAEVDKAMVKRRNFCKKYGLN